MFIIFIVVWIRGRRRGRNGKNCKKRNDSWSRKRANSERDRLADKEKR